MQLTLGSSDMSDLLKAYKLQTGTEYYLVMYHIAKDEKINMINKNQQGN